jgi:hypothetical protein
MCHHAKSTKATGTSLIKNAHIKNQVPSTAGPTTMVAWTQGDIKFLQMTDGKVTRLFLLLQTAYHYAAYKHTCNQGGQFRRIDIGTHLASSRRCPSRAMERTRQMLKVSEEVLALRTESNRVRQHELILGAALNSQADMATAQEYDAKALLLQTQTDYLQAHDELSDAMGSAPR